MYFIINFTTHLFKHSILLFLLFNSLSNLMVVVSSSSSNKQQSPLENTIMNSYSKDTHKQWTDRNRTITSPIADIESDNTYEFVKLNTSTSTSASNSTNDVKKSENLHLISRIYQRLHELHNRHHHHHLHHMGGESSFGSTLFGDRPFNRFRDRPMNEGDYSPAAAFDRPFNTRPYNTRPYNTRPYNNRRYAGRPWSRRRKRRQIDDSLDNLAEHFFYDKKSGLSQLTTQSSYLSSPSFNPNILSHSYYSSNLQSPLIQSSTKSYLSTTTPISISLTTSSASDSLINRLDSSYNNSFNSTYHHYYHQAYLLYKYFKINRNQTVDAIDWLSLPDEMRDKFKMLIKILTFPGSNTSKLSKLTDLGDEYVIGKALEIVKWKGWRLPPHQNTKRKELNRKSDDFKPILPTATVDHQQQQHLKASEFTTNKLSTQSNASPFERQWTTNQVNSIDQIDEISTDSSSSSPSTSDYSSSVSESSNNNAFTTTSTTRPLTIGPPLAMSPNDALKKVFENIEDIRTNHSCSRPRGRLFNLREINLDYRFLLPKCVYLHKCDDQVGCCSAPKQHCVPMEQEIVIKYFYNLSSNKKQNRVVRLAFVNDTGCQCREIDNVHPSTNHNNLIKSDPSSYYSTKLKFDLNEDSNSIKLNEDQFKPIKLGQSIDQYSSVLSRESNSHNQFNTNSHDLNQPQIYKHQNQYGSPTRYDSSLSNNLVQTDLDHQSNNNVKTTMNRSTNFWNKKFNGKLSVKHLFDCRTNLICPEPYTIIQNRNEQQNQCYCGCKSKNVNCIKVMNGLKRLDDYQISCILNGQCLYPECLFKTNELDFNKNTGYCPTREDVLRTSYY